jgi:hypothetical protein
MENSNVFSCQRAVFLFAYLDINWALEGKVIITSHTIFVFLDLSVMVLYKHSPHFSWMPELHIFNLSTANLILQVWFLLFFKKSLIVWRLKAGIIMNIENVTLWKKIIFLAFFCKAEILSVRKLISFYEKVINWYFFYQSGVKTPIKLLFNNVINL